VFSRRQAMQPRDLDLNEVVTSLAKMLQRMIGEHVNLQLHLHPGALAVHADAGMLDQVLMNLAINARDAMPHGGRLLIETGERNADADITRIYPEVSPGRYVWLKVSDNGEGIPPEVLPRIFDPFFTTKAPGKGTGLGLATVFGIVKQHRGWIEVRSEPGRETSFRIFIPAIEVAPAETSPCATQARGGTETILLVEDDRAMRGLTRMMLERSGYRVVEAASGVEAVKLWPEHRKQVALLLTDLVMPGGVSGPQLARRLHEDNPRLKVIFTSGYSVEIPGSDIELRAGDNFAQKPLSPDQLIKTVRRCLDD
jgi:two-component system, cell cycle sensor histidine kinase and response regulator CckA